MLFVLLWLSMVTPSPGPWIRPHYEDAFVVARSEMIVLGHFKEDSIKCITHGYDTGGGVAVSEQYHVTLVVTSVLKGEERPSEIPLIIHYGLAPRVGGKDSPRSSCPKGAIEIWDEGNSLISPSPLIEDARQDNLWFLRKRRGIYGRQQGAGPFGVVDPEDISSASLKEYYLAYLSENPDTSLKKVTSGDIRLSERAKPFLEPMDLEKILSEKHPWIRGEALLLYLIKLYRHRGDPKVGSDLKKAGDALIEIFEDSSMRDFTGDVMNVWASLRYEPGVEPMICMLGRLEAFWDSHKLEKRWLEADTDSAKEQQAAYAEMSHAISALRRIGDPRAKQAIQTVRERWASYDGGTGEKIVQACEAALERLSDKK